MTKTKKMLERKAKAKNASDAAKSGQKAAPAPVLEAEKAVLVDRRMSRDRRGSSDRRVGNVPVAVERRKLERRVKVSRRRQIDPTTCERDYTPEEIQFMTAMDEYKRVSGRMFPTCSEILEVLKTLGYEKRTVEEPSSIPQPPTEGVDCGGQAPCELQTVS